MMNRIRVNCVLFATILPASYSFTCGCDRAAPPAPPAASSVDITSERYRQQRAWLESTFEAAQQSPLDAATADRVMSCAETDPNPALRARAIVIIPLLADRARSIEALSHILDRRDDFADGVPLCQTAALEALREMKAREAIGAVQRWADFLKTEIRIDPALRADLLGRAQSAVTELGHLPATHPSDP